MERDDQASQLPEAAPEMWLPAKRFAEGKILGPIERFLHVSASSAILLVISTVIALAWANSPWGESYDHFWHTPIRLGLGNNTFDQSLHFWINDGLMVVFFFVVGLEIRREIYEGELSDIKRASLPVAAAIGGMIAPALIYFALNQGPETRSGWGVPMATDIAFAVGVLTLVGNRVPAALRVLLLALAIIDDIGAILVIAIFYSSGISFIALGVAAAGIVGVFLMQRIGVRRPLLYLAPGFVIWAGALAAGIHPTIAGVILGLVTPVRPWYGPKQFARIAHDAVDDFQERVARKESAESLAAPLERLAHAQREALPPVVRLQTALHSYSAFLIMPIFALANAGVRVAGVDLNAAGATSVLLGVIIGLVGGKIIGVWLASFVAVKLGLSALPRGVTWVGVAVVGCVAGIGFTMSIFIAGLAFDNPATLGVAKLGVLLASGTAAVVSLIVGKLALPAELPADVAKTTASQAESSTEY